MLKELLSSAMARHHSNVCKVWNIRLQTYQYTVLYRRPIQTYTQLRQIAGAYSQSTMCRAGTATNHGAACNTPSKRKANMVTVPSEHFPFYNHQHSVSEVLCFNRGKLRQWRYGFYMRLSRRLRWINMWARNPRSLRSWSMQWTRHLLCAIGGGLRGWNISSNICLQPQCGY